MKTNISKRLSSHRRSSISQHLTFCGTGVSYSFQSVQFPGFPLRSLWTNSQFHKRLKNAAQLLTKPTASLGTQTARDVSHPVSLYWIDFNNLAHSKSHRLSQNSYSLLGKQDQESVILVCNTKVTHFTWDVFSSIISLWL